MKSRTKIYVVEGPDCSGKSTFVNGQCFMGEQKDHCGPPQWDPFKEYVALIEKRTAQVDTWVVDRLHLGEHVYGPIFRGKDELGWAKSRLIDRRLLSEQSVLVLCMPPFETLMDNWNMSSVHQLPKGASDMEQVYDSYMTGQLEHHLPQVLYDYTTGPTSQYEAFLKATKSLTPLNRGLGVGCFKEGNILVIADSNHISDSPTDVLFAQLLQDLRVPEQSLYWLTPTQYALDVAQLERLKPHGVVSLGDVPRDLVRHLTDTGKLDHVQCIVSAPSAGILAEAAAQTISNLCKEAGFAF